MRRAFGLIVGLLGAVVGGVATADTGLYDGAWSVTLDCPRSDDGALPFSYAFTAEVKDGVLHGEHGLHMDSRRELRDESGHVVRRRRLGRGRCVRHVGVLRLI